MWAFCGSEHYTFNEARYIDGYKKSNKSDNHYGLDLDRFVWLQKKKHWKNVNLTIVCPSKWLTKCAKSSFLLKEYPIHNIANPIDLDVYKPAPDIKIARGHFNIPIDKKVILFSSLHKAKDPRKGFGYLDECIKKLTDKIDPSTLCIAIVGIKSRLDNIHGVDIVNLGYIEDDNDMARAYSSANVCFFPSNADSTPNTIKESMSCGTPCVAFDIEGVQEMITHQQNGYLVPVGDVTGLSEGLEWTLSQDESLLSSVVRESAFRLHDHKSRVKDYLEIYSGILNTQYSQRIN
jgi:glycosyltransferase involved in cell wall biosynthesis